jgi:hypothetical protein
LSGGALRGTRRAFFVGGGMMEWKKLEAGRISVVLLILHNVNYQPERCKSKVVMS